MLSVVKWKMSFIVAATTSEDELENAEAWLFVIRQWIHDALDGVLVIDCTDTTSIDIANMVNNPVLHVVGAPIDDAIAYMLARKFRAISNGLIEVSSLSLKSSDHGLTSHQVGAGLELGFPTKVTEYMGESEYSDTPWWERPDGLTYECFYDGDEDDTDAFIEWTNGIYDPLDNCIDGTDGVHGVNKAVDVSDVTREGNVIKLGRWKCEATPKVG